MMSKFFVSIVFYFLFLPIARVTAQVNKKSTVEERAIIFGYVAFGGCQMDIRIPPDSVKPVVIYSLYSPNLAIADTSMIWQKSTDYTYFLAQYLADSIGYYSDIAVALFDSATQEEPKCEVWEITNLVMLMSKPYKEIEKRVYAIQRILPMAASIDLKKKKSGYDVNIDLFLSDTNVIKWFTKWYVDYSQALAFLLVDYVLKSEKSSILIRFINANNQQVLWEIKP